MVQKISMTKKILSQLGQLSQQVKKSKQIEKEVLSEVNQLVKKVKSTPVVVISAFKLSQQKLTEIEDQLVLLLEKPVAIKNVVDKTILGGFKIIINTKVIDNSLKGQLDQLKIEFKELMKIS